MTDQENENKTKKLTLGAPKLSLGTGSLRSILSANKNSGVVVEVNKGKAASNVKLTLNHNAGHKKLEIDSDNTNRRLQALQRQKEANEDEHEVSTLSKIAQLNMPRTSKKIIDQEDVGKKQLEVQIQTKTDDIKFSDETVISNTKKEVPRKIQSTVKEEIKSDEEKVVVVKPKVIEQKKLKKSDILHMLSEDSSDIPGRARSLASIKRAKEKEKRKNSHDQNRNEKIYREVILPEVITVGELANRMSERAADVTRELMKLGVMATSTQSIDADTAEIIATSFGHTVKRYKESDIENSLIDSEEDLQDLGPRAPIVTVMGHVDHGKTSLLDALKSTDVVSNEAGGITQHIGAYTVTMGDGKMITFIDTPGHEAFTEMRTRGAKVTDIVVLVVAADDGIKAQTIEAINHAKAAEVPVIVAINKIDKPDADIERVKNELITHNLLPEEYGGDVMVIGVSAKQKLNLDKLEEAILLLAEMQNLKTSYNAQAAGVVIESKVDPNKGVITTVIVQKGILKKSDLIIAGKSFGRIKRICNDKGRTIESAGPSLAVELYGFDVPPNAGDVFNVVHTDKQARDIIDYRVRKAKNLKVTASKTSLEDMFLKASGNSKIKQLALIIKGDTHGSIEAINTSLQKIESNEVKVKILHNAVGAITESDVMLAQASGAIIIGFNVRANSSVSQIANDNKVDIRYYSIIYDVIDDVKAVMSGMLSPIIREVYIGSAEVREVFNITKIGKIAGSYVTKGVIKRGAGVRLLRDNIVIHEGALKTLKRFKEDVKEVREGYECGIAFEHFNDVQLRDQIEVFEIVKEQQKL
ncbi:MAG: translation initiation factor IF-2 [Rickettsiaceae bacterium]|nr:translation initiation factor IF-2 [Rickettsiaceae bacterium]